MSESKNEKPAGRAPLASTLDAPGGITEEDALVLAESALELKTKSVNAELDRVVDEIAKLTAQTGPAPARELRVKIYDLANTVHSVAATFDRRALGLAAYHLCELLDAFDTQGRWVQEAVRVHSASMLALRDDARIPPEVRMEMIEGLRQVVVKATA
jgi:hypothetical protein